MSQRVAVIGLGAMGLPVALNLLKAGFDVGGVDLNQASLDVLVGAGGQAYRSPAAAARDATIVLVIVLNGAQAELVLFGEDGAAAELKAGALVILSTTMAPDHVQSLGRRLAERDILMLDAPVTGGTRGAEEGSLVFLAGGPDAAYAKAQEILSVVARRVVHVGKTHGHGATVKLLSNLLVGVQLVATAEVIALAEKTGIDCEAFYEVVLAGTAMSRTFEDRARRMLANDVTVASVLDLFVKDLGLVLDLGRSAKGPTFLAAMAHQILLSASAAGFGKCNDTQVIELYRRAK